MNRIARASAAFALSAAATTGMLAASAGTASAVTYVNDLAWSYNGGNSADNWNGCAQGKDAGNARLDHIIPRDPQEYYYCAPGAFANGVQYVNLWYRHRA
ncbi:hypothetical protein GCM10009759_04050 [Kitasatospora saccharophila]|uniref:Secreted protein n=1 Tax=Kitasatospora saccharophila TaxID=407973 RepID=A0ABN2W661_9ACTN